MDETKKRAVETLQYVMGNDIRHFLNDESIFEIIVNPDGKIWLDTFVKGKVFSGCYLDASSARNVIYHVANMAGKVCNDDEPLLSADLEGCRFQGFLPHIVSSPSFNIRKHATRVFSLDDYVEQQVMTLAQKEVIVKGVWDRKNILAAGGTKSGKTTFLNAILAEVAKTKDRVVMIEDIPELQCKTPDLLSLCTTERKDMSTLLRATLRATPDRIVVGEVRGGEALALLDAWSTGHGGGCSTVHSNSALQTLQRLQDMVSRVSTTPQQATIGEAVDLIVYMKYNGVKRYIEEIIEVKYYDREKDRYEIQQIA